MSKHTYPTIRIAYGQPVKVTKSFSKPTLTQQSAKDECDINQIIKSHSVRELVEQSENIQKAYGDFSNIPDYQLSLNQVIQAEESFMALPSDIRSRFENSPLKFVEFARDPQNLPEMVKMGLATPRPPEPQDEPKKSDGTRPQKKEAKASDGSEQEPEGSSDPT